MTTTLLSDRDVAARVLDHVEKRTTDMGEAVWREPVANYRSTKRLAAEIERVFRRTPTPFCPSAALPEVGSFVAREAAGTPLVAIRGEDGKVRAFRNACRHRGMELASGCGRTDALVCRYHGWTYRLDGRLHHVPHQHGFPGLEKSAYGLVPAAADERLGLVFVTQEEPAVGGDLLDGLPDLLLPEQHLLAATERDIPANWKIALEGFLEGYHIRSTHPETFYPYGFDNLNVVEFCGRNGRITFPFRRIQKLADVAPDARQVDGLLTYVTHVFPNVVIATLSRHTSVVVIEPVTTESCRFVTYTVANRGHASPELRQEAKRDAEFVDESAAEDRAVIAAIQRGIASGANEYFTYGRFEALIAHFHRSMAEALGESDRANGSRP